MATYRKRSMNVSVLHNLGEACRFKCMLKLYVSDRCCVVGCGGGGAHLSCSVQGLAAAWDCSALLDRGAPQQSVPTCVSPVSHGFDGV